MVLQSKRQKRPAQPSVTAKLWSVDEQFLLLLSYPKYFFHCFQYRPKLICYQESKSNFGAIDWLGGSWPTTWSTLALFSAPFGRRYKMTMVQRRCAVIGAGAAGLSAAHELVGVRSTSGGRREFAVTVYERRSRVGGIWQHDAEPGPCRVRFDQDGTPAVVWEGAKPPGAMYEGLRTNIPSVRCVMWIAER